MISFRRQHDPLTKAQKENMKIAKQQIRVCLEIHKLNLTCSNFAVIWSELIFGQKPNSFRLSFFLDSALKSH